MRISDWSSDVCSSDLQALDLVELRLVDDGADVAALALRIAHRGAVEHRLDDADRFGLALFLDEDARRGDAALAGVDEHALHRRRQHRCELGVRQHNIRRIAAEDTTSVVYGKSGSCRVSIGGREINKK